MGHTFKDPDQALSAVTALYLSSIDKLQTAFRAYVLGRVPTERVQAFYPELRITADRPHTGDSRRSHGFLFRTGTYATTLTRPHDVFANYYRAQFEHLLSGHHDAPIEIGLSTTPIPLHFALGENFHLEGDLTPQQLADLPLYFDQPDLSLMDDQIANGHYETKAGQPMPLSLFTAPRVDLSLLRLRHYTGTSAKHFQNYVIFTNYQFYIDEFVAFAKAAVAAPATGTADDYTAFVEPGDVITARGKTGSEGTPPPRLPQMSAYHLKRADNSGITMVNIGVGPSNAKTITDHVAVLRPHAWIMLGHCAGLRNTQHLGDYVLAHAYLRLDHVLDRDLPTSIPLPALAEIQQALETAVSRVTGEAGYDLKKIMRTGTVATIDDRNWELAPNMHQNIPIAQSRAIAMDMESGTIAANGFRFRVPYGTLLCVSDKPLHGQLKLPGMADKFYRQQVSQHLQIGLEAMGILRDIGPDRLHSRKLRSFNEVAFQ